MTRPQEFDTSKGQIRIDVRPEDAGKRLDQLVVVRLGDRGRRGVGALFAEGRVRSGGRIARKGERARPGDVIVVDEDEHESADEGVVPEPDTPLTVALETTHVVVVDKPAGWPTAPLLRGETGTLVNALLARFPELAGIGYGPKEPGLLHRLDNETSGLVVVARTPLVFERLRAALSAGSIEKRYLAIVSVTPASSAGAITEPLGPDPRDRRRVAVGSPGSSRGRPFRTEWKVARRAAGCCLLEVSASRAYRHQIRAHLASVGMPLVGDLLYGGEASPLLPEGRHALHASYVAWAGDDTFPGFRVESSLPSDLTPLLSSG